MFDEYVFYVIEGLHCQEKSNNLFRAVTGDTNTGNVAIEDSVLERPKSRNAIDQNVLTKKAGT